MIDYHNSSSSVVKSVQKRDEQTMDSLQPRDQVVDKRAEPDEKRAADSSMVRCKSDHPDEFIVPAGSERGDYRAMAGRPPRLVHMSRRSVFSQIRQNLQWCLPEATQQQLLFVFQTPFRVCQDKQPEVDAM